MDITIPRGSLNGRLTPPCSKSYAQRALALSLLAEGESVLRNIEFCNDTLSAMVAVSVGADRLVLLSDIDGLYTADPHRCPDATLIHTVTELTEEIMALAGDEGSSLGTGGMKTKLHAASLCMDAECEMVILNGSEPSLLYDLFDGARVGTVFSRKGANE